jgi:hypothetical protein
MLPNELSFDWYCDEVWGNDEDHLRRGLKVCWTLSVVEARGGSEWKAQ